MHPVEPRSRHTPSYSPALRFGAVVEAVVRDSGVAPEALFHPSRCRAPVAAARQLAMYLCHVTLGQTMTAVGRYFDRDRTTVAHACAKVEDMRDDPRSDARIQALEDAVGSRLPFHAGDRPFPLEGGVHVQR